MVNLLAVKADFHFSQAGGACYLGVHQSKQMIPSPKTLAMLVCFQAPDVFIKSGARQAFQNFGKSSISIHIAAIGLLSRVNGFYPSNSMAAISPTTPFKIVPDSSARRRESTVVRTGSPLSRR